MNLIGILKTIIALLYQECNRERPFVYNPLISVVCQNNAMSSE
ncbi:MAG: hypothetical protein H6Q20_1942 [Bacteroidetes bacterium]|nr:hypothetical protein [Bacteroidota bacterium]